MKNIKQYTTKFWSYIKIHKFKAVLCIVLIVAGFILLRPEEQTVFEYISPEIKTFQTTVEGSGNVSTESSVNLVALTTGQISDIKIKPGDSVKKGQILATISNRAQLADLTKARAEYEKVVNGSSQEDITSEQTELDNAALNLEQVRKEQGILVANARRKWYSSDLIAKPYDTDISCTIPTISGAYNGNQIGEYRVSIDGSQGIRFRVSGLEEISDQSVDNDNSVPLGTQGLKIFFPDGSYECNDGDSWYVTIPNTEGENYLANYNNYQLALSTQEKAVADAEQKLKTANAGFAQVKAPSRYEEVLSAQGALQSAQANYEDTIIRAPFDGQVGKVSITAGEFVQSGTEAVTIIGEGKIAEITLNEVDVANLKVGQKAALTFDALPDLELMGSVAEIDTSGTDDSGVIIFGVKIIIGNDDDRVKPGMSVTGTITTNEKENSVVLSNTALKEDDTGEYYVLVKDINGSEKNPNKKVLIKIGLSNDIETEIVEGLSGNEEVLYREISQKETKQSGGLIQPPSGE